MSTDLAQLGRIIVDLQRRLEKVEAQSRLKSASIDDAAIVVRDGTGALRGIVGQQGDGTTAVTVVNGAPPPAPSTPTAAPALGGISAGWDGTFADGAIIPMDWARVEVHASPDTGFTPDADTLVATIETAQGGIAYIPATAPQYVRLLARNTSGAASPATAQVGPYAPKPVAGEIGIGEITETLIADGAITTPKVFANAITTPLLAAGAVDAVALKADAITGKIITGGTINGAEFHSDDGAGGLVDILNGTVIATAANGRKIAIDPANFVPVLYFMNAEGEESAAINATESGALAGLNISSGPFTEGSVTDYRWIQTLGERSAPPYNVFQVSRTRDSDETVRNGGFIFLDGTKAQYGIQDTTNTSVNTVMQVTKNLFVFDEGRMLIDSSISSFPALAVAAKTGHTGHLIRAVLNDVTKFSVSTGGEVTAAGSITGSSLTTTGNATIGGNLGTTNITVTGQITKDTTWSTLSTGPGWTGYGGAYGTGRYRRMPDGSVVIRDLINRTASTTIPSGETVATLPAGYRPVTQVQQNIFVGGSSGGSLSININTNGTITLTNITPGAVTYLSTGSGYISLNGYQFWTD